MEKFRRSDDSSDEYKTLADQIRLKGTRSQNRMTMIFQMLLEQGCVTGHELQSKKQTIG